MLKMKTRIPWTVFIVPVKKNELNQKFIFNSNLTEFKLYKSKHTGNTQKTRLREKLSEIPPLSKIICMLESSPHIPI